MLFDLKEKMIIISSGMRKFLTKLTRI